VQLAHHDFHNDGFIHLVGGDNALEHQLSFLQILNVGIHDILLGSLRLLAGGGFPLGEIDEGFDASDLAANVPLLQRVFDMADNHLEAQVEIFLSEVFPLGDKFLDFQVFE
jgi:hypothetical protein